MARYIDADKAKQEFNIGFGGVSHAVIANQIIDSIPTADVVEVKHGEWKTDEEDLKWGNSLKRKYCSVCKNRPHFDREKREFILTPFCPNCGAKMDK